MINRFLKMINRISAADDQPEAEHSKEELMQWAVGCMLEGLPDNFFEAWVEYNKNEDGNDISYKFIPKEGAEVKKFHPADDLYPVQCINLLEEHLEKNEEGWKKCIIKFSPNFIKLDYE